MIDRGYRDPALAAFVEELSACAPAVGGRCAVCKCLALVCVDMLLPTPGDLVCAECAFYGRDIDALPLDTVKRDA